MEVIIRTKKSFWEVSCKGIRRVNSMDWNNAVWTVEAMFIAQTEEAERVNKASPVGQVIDETVEIGAKSAVIGDAAWRKGNAARARQETEGNDASLLSDGWESF